MLAFLFGVKQRRGPKMLTDYHAYRKYTECLYRIPPYSRPAAVVSHHSRMTLVLLLPSSYWIKPSKWSRIYNNTFKGYFEIPIGLKENLQEEDNLSTRNNWPVPKVSFVPRFYCMHLFEYSALYWMELLTQDYKKLVLSISAAAHREPTLFLEYCSIILNHSNISFALYSLVPLERVRCITNLKGRMTFSQEPNKKRIRRSISKKRRTHHPLSLMLQVFINADMTIANSSC